ncbi:hypothetical protein TNCT_325521 [Trichonephila clavata]|uniref:Uncharacterized protein n=1 Tax=Trichonephila clavata TaxID=2740835 RepID=A0A8X6JMJ1_TRICU|nr:hypothetical protein TNCT_325521 [Trichonephila clavata]
MLITHGTSLSRKNIVYFKKFGQNLLQADQMCPDIQRTGQKVRLKEEVPKNSSLTSPYYGIHVRRQINVTIGQRAIDSKGSVH